MKRNHEGWMFLEIAVVAAAGFVLWRNRHWFREYLENSGVDVDDLFRQAQKYFKLGEDLAHH